MENDEAAIFGKRIVTKRKVAWYAETDFEYTYSNVTKRALPWTKGIAGTKIDCRKKKPGKLLIHACPLTSTMTEVREWLGTAMVKQI